MTHARHLTFCGADLVSQTSEQIDQFIAKTQAEFAAKQRHTNDTPMTNTDIPTGFRACFATCGEHHDVVLPEAHPSFEEGVPSSSQWFATRQEAQQFVDSLIDGIIAEEVPQK